MCVIRGAHQDVDPWDCSGEILRRRQRQLCQDYENVTFPAELADERPRFVDWVGEVDGE